MKRRRREREREQRRKSTTFLSAGITSSTLSKYSLRAMTAGVCCPIHPWKYLSYDSMSSVIMSFWLCCRMIGNGMLLERVKRKKKRKGYKKEGEKRKCMKLKRNDERKKWKGERKIQIIKFINIGRLIFLFD